MATRIASYQVNRSYAPTCRVTVTVSPGPGTTVDEWMGAHAREARGIMEEAERVALREHTKDGVPGFIPCTGGRRSVEITWPRHRHEGDQLWMEGEVFLASYTVARVETTMAAVLKVFREGGYFLRPVEE